MDAPLPTNLVECWEQVANNGARNFSITNLFDHPTLFPLQRIDELFYLVDHVFDEMDVVMEIGSDKGGLVYAMCREVRPNKMIACEVRGTPYGHVMERMFPDIKFLWLPYSSYDSTTLDKVREFLGEDKIDGLFIDGDKSQFKLDFDTYRPLMNPLGTVVMHDIVCEPMKTVFEQCSKDLSSEAYVDVSQWHRYVSEGKKCVTRHDYWLETWKTNSCGLGIIHLDTRGYIK